MKFLKSIFKRTTVEAIQADHLHEARCMAERHRAAAEHHQALADMYAGRAQRIAPAMNTQQFGVSLRGVA